MASAFRKEVLRSITQSAGRFAAIAIISFLGAGFYGGLRMAAPDMRLAGDEFFDGGNLHDIRVVGTLGFDDQGVQALGSVPGIEAAMPTRSAAVMLELPEGSYAAQVESLPVQAARASSALDAVQVESDDASYLNRPLLLEGAWPQGARDCLVSADAAADLGLSVGDTVRIVKGEQDVEDVFAVRQLTVCGLVNSAAYAAAHQYGTTSLGTGDIDLYAYVGDAAFDADYPYTNVYLTVAGARDLQWGTSSYDRAVDDALALVRPVAAQVARERYDTVISDAQRELADARADYERERADAEAELADARAQLDDAAAELADARAQLDDAAAEMADGRAQLDDSAAQIALGREQLRQAEADYAAGVEELAAQRQQVEEGFAAGQQQIDEQRAALAEGVAQLDFLRAQRDALQMLPELPPEKQQALAVLQEQIDQIEAGAAALDAAQAQLDAERAQAEQQLADAQAQLDAARAQLDEGWAQSDAGMTQYADGEYDYEAGLAEYRDGEREYAEGLAEYRDAEREYADAVAEAEEGFADAERELADAQAKIDDIEPGDVFVVARDKNPGAASLASDADGIAQIASVFPFMFFLVAALVSLTSMTRMVDEERQVVGTHKALGYSRARITGKYLVYGLLASGLGSILGVAVLGRLLPWFIMASYQISYAVPVIPLPIEPVTAIKAVGLSMGVTALATWGAAAASLRERPAALMLPRVPKAGKRILLERIRPLWARMTFSQKVTARNLLRYKRRFLMAVVGVAGCTALLMVGFGLRDAIGGIVENQFSNLVGYDVVVRLDEDASAEQRARVDSLLDDAGVDERLQVLDDSMLARAAGAADGSDDVRMQVVVPADADALGDFVALRDRASGNPLALGEDTIVITEKAASVLGVQVGDTVQLYESNQVGDAEGDPIAFTVGGVAENYLGHYAYMAPAAYERALGRPAGSSTLYLKLPAGEDGRQLADALLDTPGVNTVSFVSDKMSAYEEMLDVMNKLIFVIVAAAAALAFVVLYNLTNINIGERVREIATLKVLGFTRGEVHAYIFREVFVMSVIGGALGCMLGVPLTTYIAIAAETPQMMFGRSIEPASFVFSFVLTVAFTAIVAIAMRGKLARVDMVESLKSVE